MSGDAAVTRFDRLHVVGLGVALFLSYAWFYQAGGWNQNSRFDLVRAIVERRELRIDADHHNTGDKALFEGHYYSDKAPGLSLSAVPVVGLARAGMLAWGVDAASPRAIALLSYLATVFTSGLAAALAGVLLYTCARQLGFDPDAARWSALALALGTPAWCYATLFFGHALATSCLLLEFAAALALRSTGSAGRDRRLGALLGASAGWAVVTEFPSLPAAGLIAALGWWSARAPAGRWRRVSFAVASGGAAAAIVLVVYNWASMGSPFRLAYAHTIHFGAQHLGPPRASVLAEVLVGRFRGLLPLAPVLAFAPLGAAALWRERRLRAPVVISVAISLCYLLLAASAVTWSGGWSYGPRHLSLALPFLALLTFGAWRPAGAALRVVLAGLTLYGVSLSLIAVTTTAQPPESLRDPVRQLLWPAFRDGDLALNPQSFLDSHADPDRLRDPALPRAAWNLGQLVGLSGHASLLPLYALWAALLMVLAGAGRGRPREVDAPAAMPLGRGPSTVAAAAGAVIAILILRDRLVPDPLEQLAASATGPTTVYQGAWLLPRGGPYVLGFESPDGAATLSVGGRSVARGRGIQSGYEVFDAGPASVRFEAPRGARLLWLPPGRRGRLELEYVPPSSLSPDSPERARFGRSAGASPLDGIAAVLIGLLMAGAPAIVRGWDARGRDRKLAGCAAAAFVFALSVSLVDLGGAGQTWDEDVYWSAGRNYVTNWLSLDFSRASWRWNFEHPPVTKYLAGIAAQFTDGYGPARSLSAVLMAAACSLLVPIGARLFSLPVGALAAVIAALTPHLIAHGKIVGHEAPAAFLWSLGVWLVVRVCPRLPDRPEEHRFTSAAVGTVVGLAVMSRFANLLLVPLLAALVLVLAPSVSLRRRLATGALAALPVALAVAFVSWPLLWHGPIDALGEAWAVLRRLHSREPFLGVLTNQPPPYYFALYLFATAPAGILLAAGAGIFRCAQRREPGLSAVLLWLMVPLLVSFSPVRQDGVRYVVPSLLALALLAAAGVDHLARVLTARRFGTYPRSFAMLASASVAYLALTCARIHPYYLDYYGEHVGGPRAVTRSLWFETAWWGEGLEEAVEVLNRSAAPSARVYLGCVEARHVVWMRADLSRSEAPRPDAADWILASQPIAHPCPLPGGAELVHEVTAQGAPLVRLYRLRRSP